MTQSHGEGILFVSPRPFTSGDHEAKSLLSRIYETAEPDSAGCRGRWFAARGSMTCSSTGSAGLKPWGLAGSVGTGRHQEDTPGMRLGSSPVWEACCPWLTLLYHKYGKHVSPPSHAELLPGPQIKSKKHFLTFLWFFISYILSHCRPVFCQLGACHLWGMTPGRGNNRHRMGTTHRQLSPVKSSSSICL